MYVFLTALGTNTNIMFQLLDNKYVVCSLSWLSQVFFYFPGNLYLRFDHQQSAKAHVGRSYLATIRP